MPEIYKTEQEEFWAGDFGNNYSVRNDGKCLLASKLALFSQIMRCRNGLKSCLEIGPNLGLNLEAIYLLAPEMKLAGIEINRVAHDLLVKKFQDGLFFNQSILDFDEKPFTGKYDLVLTSGVLIHINPEQLDMVYDKIHKISSKYILLNEYYNPEPIKLEYRGNAEKLFKRDFAGEFMTKFKDVSLIDYGFQYRGGPRFPGGDNTWFLMEKR